MAQQLSTNNFGPAKWIVNSTSYLGTHTTIAAAITSASSGETIFIMPGTYTENLTMKAGVNLVAYTADAVTPNVTIIGSLACSYSGIASISGLQVQTNSNACIAVTGSTNTRINVIECFLIGSNNDIITNTGSGNAQLINLYRCQAIKQTTGIKLFSIDSGGLNMFYCVDSNGGSSVTPSTLTSNAAQFFDCTLNSPITTSSTSTISFDRCTVNAINTTALTCGGSGGGTAWNTLFVGGSASAVSVGTGSTLNMYECLVNSSNTNAITGLGALNYSPIAWTGSSSTINTSTATPTAYGPVAVSQGGTGDTSLTAYAVLTGGTTSTGAVQSIASVGTSGQVLTSNGAGALPTFQGTSASKITSFTSNGSWTIDTKTKFVEFYVWSGGGGGGSGRCGVSGAAGGGAGGAGGNLYYLKSQASLITGSPYTITVGTGGAGGIAINAVTTNGNPGTQGNPSSVGALIVVPGGAGGAGGVNGTATGGTSLYFSLFSIQGSANGGNGANAVATSANNYVFGWSGGGGGGSGYATTTARIGAAAASITQPDQTTVIVAGGLAGDNAGNTAGNGNPGLTGLLVGGTGGGGGGHDATTVAGTGGNGGTPSGGGGGGAGNLSSNASGAGGNGADGRIIIVEYF